MVVLTSNVEGTDAAVPEPLLLTTASALVSDAGWTTAVEVRKRVDFRRTVVVTTLVEDPVPRV